MHKGIILLIKADNKEDARKKVDEWMTPYGNGDVWDWYVVGGRWSGTLNEKNMEFEKKVRELVPAGSDFGYSNMDIERNADKFQSIWEEIGGEGKNPFNRDQYKDVSGEDDILPLAKCLAVVKEWQQDPMEAGDSEIKSAEEWLEKHPGDVRMKGYFYKKAGELYHQDFCFDTNVFNTEEYNYQVPEEVEGWYAVMVDIHN